MLSVSDSCFVFVALEEYRGPAASALTPVLLYGTGWEESVVLVCLGWEESVSACLTDRKGQKGSKDKTCP